MDEIKKENEEMIKIQEEQIDPQEEAKKATQEESNVVVNEENIAEVEMKANDEMQVEKPGKLFIEGINIYLKL